MVLPRFKFFSSDLLRQIGLSEIKENHRLFSPDGSCLSTRNEGGWWVLLRKETSHSSLLGSRSMVHKNSTQQIFGRRTTTS